jgi:hypothetical protein
VNRRGAVPLAVVGVLVLGTAGWVAVSGGEQDDGGAGEQPPAERATVEQRDLERRLTFDGTVGHGDAAALPGQASGVVTSAPAVGDVIEAGSVLYEVDGAPVVLLPGAVPAYRALSYAAGPGDDVEQLEQYLADAGFGDGVTVDTEWTGETTEAVQRWQESLGLDTTGEIELGRVVFWPEAVRVESVTSGVGDRAEGSVLSVTSTDQAVALSADEADVGRFEVGGEVEVTLADGSGVTGTVAAITEPESDGDSTSMMPDDSGETATVTVVLPESVDASAGDSVEGALVVDRVEDALTVPVSALLALAEGGYAVELVEASGATTLVGVETGLISDGLVAVTGDLVPGDEVVVP